MDLRRAAFRAKVASPVFGPSWRDYCELVRHDGLSADEIRALNERAMLRQARFAYEHTAFYPRHYRDHGIEAGDLARPDVLSHLPLVTKEHIRERGSEFLSDECNPKTSGRVATGGSTGEPLAMKRDTRLNARAYEWRLMRWWGLAPYVDTAIVYRFFRSRTDTLKQGAVWWPSRRFQLDAFNMTRASMDDFLAMYRAIRPEFVLGYTGGVLELARHAQERGLVLPGSPVIATTAAPVPWPLREEIEAAFGGRVYDHYRSAELNWIAGECRNRDGLHVFEDLKRVEVVDAAGDPVPDGQEGEVVVTDLTNRVFPLVRYRLGDVSARVAGSCRCRLPYPRIRSIGGRVSDSVVLPGGDVIAGESLAQAFSRVAEAVRQFQVHQLPDHSISVKVIPTGSPDDPRIAEAVDRLRSVVHGAVPVRLEFVDGIPHDGGKVRFIRSDVARDPGPGSRRPPSQGGATA